MNVEYLKLLFSVAPAAIAALVSVMLGAGRRQRLKLAIDVQDGIPADQKALWEEMIRRDVEAIRLRSLQPIPPIPPLVAGATLYALAFIPAIPPVAQIAMQLAGVGTTLVAMISSLTYFFRVRALRNSLTKRNNDLIVETDRLRVEIEREKQKQREDEQAHSNFLRAHGDWTSRALYIAGAPMGSVRLARVEKDVDRLPKVGAEIDRLSWRVRRAGRRKSPYVDGMTLQTTYHFQASIIRTAMKVLVTSTISRNRRLIICPIHRLPQVRLTGFREPT